MITTDLKRYTLQFITNINKLAQALHVHTF